MHTSRPQGIGVKKRRSTCKIEPRGPWHAPVEVSRDNLKLTESGSQDSARACDGHGKAMRLDGWNPQSEKTTWREIAISHREILGDCRKGTVWSETMHPQSEPPYEVSIH